MKHWLIFPAAALMVVFFVFPIGTMLTQSFYNTTIETALPLTTQQLKNGIIDHEALRQDLTDDRARKVINYINHYYPGARSLFAKTINNIQDIDNLVEYDSRWADPGLWKVLEYETHRFTAKNYIKIFESVDSVYFKVLMQTLTISLAITAVTVLLSYPLAYFLTTVTNRWHFVLMMFCILLPFFTSYLSRLVAWLVLLQKNGLINQILSNFDISLNLMYNTAGIFIGSVYILLPMAVLPIYAAMRNIDLSLIKTGSIVGANKYQVFRDIYFPLTKTGIYNAALLVFMTVIGFYTTPALLGGSKGKFITEQIVYNMEVSLNWGLATALTSTLLVIILIIFYFYSRVNKDLYRD